MASSQETTRSVPRGKTRLSKPTGWKQMQRQNELFNQTLGFLLEREETLLGNIVEECNRLVKLADEQATEVADMLDQEA